MELHPKVVAAIAEYQKMVRVVNDFTAGMDLKGASSPMCKMEMACQVGDSEGYIATLREWDIASQALITATDRAIAAEELNRVGAKLRDRKAIWNRRAQIAFDLKQAHRNALRAFEDEHLGRL